MTNALERKSDHEIEPFFLSRWSRRAFSGEAVPDAILQQVFEAARWAPSGGNVQPWRFVYVRRESAQWQAAIAVLNERNRVWAAGAGALIAIISHSVRETDQGKKPHRSHSFDAGAAWANLGLQAHLLGWGTRAMGGFDQLAARSLFAVPEDYELEAIVALGHPTEVSALPADFQSLEKPTGRKPLSDLVRENSFSF